MKLKIMRKKSRIIFYIIFAAIFIPFALKASYTALPDPINASGPLDVFARVIKGFLGFVGVFALLNFVIAGFGIITSRGNSEKIEKHKQNLVWTTIGIILIIGSYSILSYVFDKLAGN